MIREEEKMENLQDLIWTEEGEEVTPMGQEVYITLPWWTGDTCGIVPGGGC